MKGKIKFEELAGVWLGLENRDGVWFERHNSKKEAIPIAYSNWSDFYSTNRHRHDYLCPYMHQDGAWAYKRNQVCNYFTKSVVCSFTKVPTFILKGHVKRFSKVERLYYMVISPNSIHLTIPFS